jgi:hypothetical protein
MWDWISCNVLGRHREVVTADRSSMHLRCIRCGHRTAGWQLTDRRPELRTPPMWRPPAAQMAPRQTS